MPNPLSLLFDTDGFVPRWECGAWTSLHGWTHIVSDTAIFAAYAAIPVALGYFVLKRKDVPFPPIFWWFGAFILACGTTHLVDATLFWHPWYRFYAFVKVVTAVASWGTVVALIRILPRAMELPGLAKITKSLELEVAERKRAEAQWRRAAAIETAILDAALDAIISMDEQGRVEGWNRAAERIFGYPAHAAMGRAFDELIVPEEWQRYRTVLGALRASDPGSAPAPLVEMPVRRADGSELTTELFIRRMEGAGPVCYTAFVRDITERKRAEERQRRAEERIRIVVEAAPNAMMMVDAGGQITLVNSQTERLFGYGRAELLGQRVDLLVPERYRAAHPGLRAGFFHAPAVRPMGAGRDLYGRRQDGSEVPIEIGLNPVHTEEGDFVLASIIDITERKQVEAQRQAALAETETLLKEVHHRVKNNMQVISSLLGLHAAKLRDPSPRAVLDDCRSRIRAMALIHERLYTAGQFARIEFGAYLAEMVRSVFSSSLDLGERVQLDLSVEPLEVTLDTAVPLSLIASELVLNALKHAFAGGRAGRLAVRLRAGETMHELTVADDGPGFPAGFTSAQSPGVGIELIDNLTRQIRGTREFVPGSGGASVVVRWPAQPLRPGRSGAAKPPDGTTDVSEPVPKS